MNSLGCSKMNRPSSFITPALKTATGTSAKNGKSNGGSAKTKSNRSRQWSRNRNTSVLNTRAFLIFNVFNTSPIKRKWLKSFSTRIVSLQPLLINSYAILPVPENKSRAVFPEKSYRFSRILKSPSLAKSVVGRAENFLLGVKIRP